MKKQSSYFGHLLDFVCFWSSSVLKNHFVTIIVRQCTLYIFQSCLQWELNVSGSSVTLWRYSLNNFATIFNILNLIVQTGLCQPAGAALRCACAECWAARRFKFKLAVNSNKRNQWRSLNLWSEIGRSARASLWLFFTNLIHFWSNMRLTPSQGFTGDPSNLDLQYFHSSLFVRATDSVFHDWDIPNIYSANADQSCWASACVCGNPVQFLLSSNWLVDVVWSCLNLLRFKPGASHSLFG